MKKKILRVIAGATLMVAMAVGFLMNNGQDELSLKLDSLDTVAMAGSESSTDYCNRYCSYNPYYWCTLETSSAYIFCNEKFPEI